MFWATFLRWFSVCEDNFTKLGFEAKPALLVPKCQGDKLAGHVAVLPRAKHCAARTPVEFWEGNKADFPEFKKCFITTNIICCLEYREKSTGEWKINNS